MTEIRWKQRFENYNTAYNHLEQLSKRKQLDWVETAALIKFFEIVFELAWKTLKDYMNEQGIITKSPREALKQAYRLELIQNGVDWLDALEKRNTTTHR